MEGDNKTIVATVFLSGLGKDFAAVMGPLQYVVDKATFERIERALTEALLGLQDSAKK